MSKTKTLSIDIDLSPETVKAQTAQILTAINSIGASINKLDASIANIFNLIEKKSLATANTVTRNMSKVNKSSLMSPSAQQEYYMQNGQYILNNTGKLSSTLTNVGQQQGQREVLKNAIRNVALETEITDQNYKQVRANQILNDYKRKQLDNEIKEELGLKKVKEQTKKVANETKKINEETKKVATSTNTWVRKLIRAGAGIAIARRLGRTLAQLVKESGAWVENLNLFEVTFGKSYQKYLDWSIQFAKNLGFSTNEMVKFTGLFKQLSTSIGIADEVGDGLSKTLTQIGVDITSFYNLKDVTQAMEKLQAGIFSGQTKPLRSIGIDVTYQSIDNLLETNEALAKFNTTSKKLDQSQKAIARTILVLQGSENAWGDTAKTINTLSNQIRVLQGTTQNLKLALGDTFAEPFRKALIYINGFLIGVTDLIRSFKALNTATGNSNDSVKDKNPAQSLTDDIEETIEEEEKLEKALAGFDKFNVLQSSGSKSSLSTGDLEITKALEEELAKVSKEFQERQEEVAKISKNIATNIAKIIHDWFVFTDDEGVVRLTENFKGLLFVLGGLGGYGLYKTIMLSKTATEGLTKGMVLLSKICTPTGLAISAIVVALLYMYKTNENFRKSINNLVNVLLKVINSVLEPLMGIIATITPYIGELLNVLAELLSPIIDIISNVIEFLDNAGLLQSTVTFIIGSIVMINMLMSQNPIGAVITAVVTLGTIIGVVLKKAGVNFKELWQNIKDGLRGVGNFFANIGVGIADGFIKLVNLLIDTLNALLSPIDAVAELFGGELKIPHWDADVSKYYNAIPAFAKGGVPDVGSLFYAGEAGAELVGNMGGRTNVVNMEQLQEAVNRGALGAILTAYEVIGSSNQGQEISIQLDGKEIYNSVKNNARANGEGFIKVR